MTAIIWTDVTALPGASGLSTVSAGHQTTILAYVNGVGVAVDVLDGENGPTSKLARTHLAAHMASLAARGAAGGTGAITAASEGGVSVSYAQPAFATDPTLRETPYGVLFLFYISRAPKARGMVVC